MLHRCLLTLLDTPSGSATTHKSLCGVVPGLLQQLPCQVATSSLHSLTQTTLSKLRSKAKFEIVQVHKVDAMQGVTYTKRDAQEAMQKLLQGNVVLVGHALHHDLHALQLDPTAVIDTALLCSYKYANSCPNLCSV